MPGPGAMAKTLAKMARVCSVAFVLCALATLYPAWRAAATLPAQALRQFFVLQDSDQDRH